MKLSSFNLLRPPYEIEQGRLLHWMAEAHQEAQHKKAKVATGSPPSGEGGSEPTRDFHRLLGRFACKPDLISKRGVFLEDYLLANNDDRQLMHISADRPEGPSMNPRMEFYQRAACAALQALFEPEQPPPSQLIHVTCTGYLSPSPAQRIVAANGWNQSTEVLHAYHMGCYAAFPALKMARGLNSSQRVYSADRPTHSSGSIRVAHTEICSLHFNPSDHRPDQLVVQSLFADGAISYAIGDSFEDEHFDVLCLREEIIPDSAEDMTWVCSNWGMKMTLSKLVPQKIKSSLNSFLQRLFSQAGISVNHPNEIPYWAVHPGGPKILNQIQSLLELEDTQLEASRNILYNYGNMSSATLPHVWHKLLDDHRVSPGDLVVSLAFGPGLTVCGGVFRKAGGQW